MLQSSNKILTWHPAGKRGVYIPKKEYDLISDFILAVLETKEMTLKDLIELGHIQLAHKTGKDISWYILVVKLDLEARGLIAPVVKPGPHRSQFLKLRPRALKKYKLSSAFVRREYEYGHSLKANSL
jgi:hypothetical protein